MSGHWEQSRTPNLAITYTGGLCLKAVREAFGIGAKYGTAMADWNSGENGKGNHHELPPAGVCVPVYFSLGNEPAGHIAISLPDGRVASSTQSGTHQGLYIHPNLNDLLRVYAKYQGSCNYLGWSEGTNSTAVVRWVEDAPNTDDQLGGIEVTPIEDFKNCWITLAQDWPSNAQIEEWQRSGMLPYQFTQRFAPNNVAKPAIEAQVTQLTQDLDKTKVEVFRQSWRTRASDWPSKTEIDNWQHTVDEPYAYSRAHAASSTEQLLQAEIDRLQKLVSSFDGQPASTPAPAEPIFTPGPAEEQPTSFWQIIIKTIESLLGGGK